MNIFFVLVPIVVLIGTWLPGVDANCFEYCDGEVPGWVCRHEDACATCSETEVTCSQLCATCPYTLYGGAACSCEPPTWEGNCFEDQMLPGDETTARLDWYSYDDTFFFPRRDYLFKREEFAPLSATDPTMIAGVLFTSTKNTLKMTTIFPPLHPSESRTAELLVYAAGASNPTYTITSTIKDHTWHCLFRIENFNVEAAYSYEIRYQADVADTGTLYTLDGVIPAQVDYPKVAALGCFGNDNSPTKDKFVQAVLEESPDIVVLQGDQTYMHQQLLYGFYELAYSLRDITKDVPTIVQMDDHDYGAGNLWGAERANENSGVGFPKAPCLVNYNQDMALGHLPDPVTGTPLDSGITVHYTNYEYGEVDFAILEARKFKSYNVDGTILGSDQEAWLASYCSDTTKAKVVLAQTPFANLNTHFYYSEGKLQNGEGQAAKDSNGFPGPGREIVMQTLQNCGNRPVVVLSGDIHMSAAVTYHNYGVSECASPAAVNDVFWRLSQYPVGEPIEDPFGNQMTMLEVYNVPQSVMDAFDSPNSSQGASDALKGLRGDGFLTFDMGPNKATCEAHGYRDGNEVMWQVDLPVGSTLDPSASPSESPSASPSSTPSEGPSGPILEVPPIIPFSGPCWNDCLIGNKFKWLCNKQTGCTGCTDRETVCDRLCSGCQEDDPLGGIGPSCDCPPPPEPTPPPGHCFGDCAKEAGSVWLCQDKFTNWGCEDCPDPQSLCPALCTRCQRGSNEALITGITCDCSIFA